MNTQKPAQGGCQNEATKKHGPKKEQNKTREEELKEGEATNLAEKGAHGTPVSRSHPCGHHLGRALGLPRTGFPCLLWTHPKGTPHRKGYSTDEHSDPRPSACTRASPADSNRPPTEGGAPGCADTAPAASELRLGPASFGGNGRHPGNCPSTSVSPLDDSMMRTFF